MSKKFPAGEITSRSSPDVALGPCDLLMAFPTTVYHLWLISSKLTCCLMTPIVAIGIYMMDKGPRELSQRLAYSCGGISFCLALTFIKMLAIYLSYDTKCRCYPLFLMTKVEY